MARKLELLPPFSVQNQLEDRISRLIHVLEYKKNRLQSAPPGILNISVCKNTYQYYQLEKINNSWKKKYLSKKNSQTKKALAQKEYDKNLIEALKKDIENYKKAFSLLKETSATLYTKLHPARKTLVTPLTLTDEEYKKLWLSQEYTKKPFRNTDKTYNTAAGHQVRSKSEVIIADTLTRLGVPYRYEFPVSLPSYTAHPDFYCLNLRTRQEFCWEHFGMMGDSDYAENAVRKINAYAASGWLPGVNFICTFETQNQPLQSQLVEKLIQTYLK